MYDIFEQLLEQKGVLAADVCRATGISQQTISTWKKRRGGISAKTAAKIAAFFGVSVAYLMGESDRVQNSGQDEGYYVYGETAKVAQEIFENKDMRILFDAARDSKPEDIRRAADILQRFKATNPDG